LNKEQENRFLILFALNTLGRVSTKKEVLDHIEINGWIKLSNQDIAILGSRNEPKWRNELAFVRQHLVSDGILSSTASHGKWEMTAAGEVYFNDVINKLDTTFEYSRITRSALNTLLLNHSKAFLREQISQDILNDSNVQNETIERKIQLVKRYKSIIVKLKGKYNSMCQIENCDFTFVKSNGENYSEAHHLIQLSENGSQDESNVVILCPNHHRMFHFADVIIFERKEDIRKISFNGSVQKIIYKN
jgi:predicted HNH restriction endonuclease